MAFVEINARLVGGTELQRTLRKAQKAVSDLRPVWGDLDERITEREDEQFRTEGGLTGGWPPLNPHYRALKARTRGWRVSVMQRTGALMRSLVNPADPNAVHRVKTQEYERGTSLPYVAAHMKKHGNRPARSPLVWDESDERFVVESIRKRIFGFGI